MLNKMIKDCENDIAQLRKDQDFQKPLTAQFLDGRLIERELHLIELNKLKEKLNELIEDWQDIVRLNKNINSERAFSFGLSAAQLKRVLK